MLAGQTSLCWIERRWNWSEEVETDDDDDGVMAGFGKVLDVQILLNLFEGMDSYPMIRI
jgi:hypothetical protein